VSLALFVNKQITNQWLCKGGEIVTIAYDEKDILDVSVIQTTTMAKPAPLETNHLTDSEEVFEKAADIFRVMSAPMRLRIISALCNGEKNVGDLLAEIDTTQPNMSQHLNTLYQAGVVGKRREGVQIYYRIINDRVVTLCRAVCVQIASESD
jgi:ArsR family transcriptional regulator